MTTGALIVCNKCDKVQDPEEFQYLRPGQQLVCAFGNEEMSFCQDGWEVDGTTITRGEDDE